MPGLTWRLRWMKACKMKLVNKINRYFLCKNVLTRNLYPLYIRNRRAKITPEEVGVICSYNLGETYLFCAMLESFKRKYNIRKVVLISDKKYHQDICALFEDRNIRCCTCSGLQERPFRVFREVRAGSLYYMHDNDGQSVATLAQKRISYIQHLKITAGLDADTAIVPHEISDQDRAGAKEIFNRLELKPNKTVLLSPEANSCPPLDEQFCQNMCDELQKKRYDVFLNVIGENHGIRSAKSAFLPLRLAAPFSDLCGLVVAMRSGFCEVISGSRARFHVLYPDRPLQMVYSLKDVITSDCLREYVLNEIPQKDRIDQVIKNIESQQI
jgi:hypothetical protein